MQSYLGEYPGSRINSDIKFLRAVRSFINQSDKNNELIIVSDGCMITHDLYYKYFKSESRVKYVYLDKDTPNMYEGVHKYYRGLPREIGKTLSTGDIITYMDSDDFLVVNHCESLSNVWSINKDATAIMNISWYENIDALNFESYIEDDRSNIEPIKIEGLDGMWYSTKINCKLVFAPWLFSHKPDIKTKWRDAVGEGQSEDIIFAKSLLKEGVTLKTKIPIYVKCHHSGRWDY